MSQLWAGETWIAAGRQMNGEAGGGGADRKEKEARSGERGTGGTEKGKRREKNEIKDGGVGKRRTGCWKESGKGGNGEGEGRG